MSDPLDFEVEDLLLKYPSPTTKSSSVEMLLKEKGFSKAFAFFMYFKTVPKHVFFSQYMVQQIQTPLFILNAAYDSWQIRNILAPVVAGPHGAWRDCKLDIKQCSSS